MRWSLRIVALAGPEAGRWLEIAAEPLFVEILDAVLRQQAAMRREKVSLNEHCRMFIVDTVKQEVYDEVGILMVPLPPGIAPWRGEAVPSGSVPPEVGSSLRERYRQAFRGL